MIIEIKSEMKGIILAGGSGTRLYPITKTISKQLMPIYDKPMIYYPLSVLMLAGIKEVLIISTPEDLPKFQRLLGSGSNIGMQFSYKAQPSPDGIAQALIIGREFIGDENVCLILGDNIYFGHELPELLFKAIDNASSNNATIFGYHVNDPERYGVIEFDDNGKVISLEEKPSEPKSSFAVTGLYFYPNDVVKKVVSLNPSDRGELEITDLNQMFLNEKRLSVELMGRGYAWLDTGTHKSLLDASVFIETIENRQGLKVACLEEIAFDKNFITKNQLIKLAEKLSKTQYGDYLLRCAQRAK